MEGCQSAVPLPGHSGVQPLGTGRLLQGECLIPSRGTGWRWWSSLALHCPLDPGAQCGQLWPAGAPLSGPLAWPTWPLLTLQSMDPAGPPG